MTVNYDSYMDRLEELCRQRNITLEELAVALGYPKNKFKRRPNGMKIMKLSDLNNLCYYFNIQPNDLLA